MTWVVTLPIFSNILDFFFCFVFFSVIRFFNFLAVENYDPNQFNFQPLNANTLTDEDLAAPEGLVIPDDHPDWNADLRWEVLPDDEEDEENPADGNRGGDQGNPAPGGNNNNNQPPPSPDPGAGGNPPDDENGGGGGGGHDGNGGDDDDDDDSRRGPPGGNDRRRSRQPTPSRERSEEQDQSFHTPGRSDLRLSAALGQLDEELLEIGEAGSAETALEEAGSAGLGWPDNFSWRSSMSSPSSASPAMPNFLRRRKLDMDDDEDDDNSNHSRKKPKKNSAEQLDSPLHARSNTLSVSPFLVTPSPSPPPSPSRRSATSSSSVSRLREYFL